MLRESIRVLDLSGNTLGQSNGNAFHGLNNVERLYSSETNLKFTESNPFKHLNTLTALDVSYHDLKTLNVTLFATIPCGWKSL